MMKNSTYTEESYFIDLKIMNGILDYDMTIREVAKDIGMSKSAVHKHIHSTIKEFYPSTYKAIQKVLDKHYQTKHINGGEATRLRYLYR